jgi:MFS family permease
MRKRSSGGPRHPAYAWCVVGVLLVAYTVSLLDRQILSLMVQPIRRELGVTDVQIGLLQGLAFVLFYSTLGLFLGRVADKRNRRNMIIIGMIVWCIATAACGFAHNFRELFLARMIVGAGEATLTPAAYSMIADYFVPERRARASTIFAMGVFMGAGLAMTFGGLAMSATSGIGDVTLPLIGSLRGWRAAFVIVGLPGLLAAALMLAVREPMRRERGVDGAHRAATMLFFRTNAVILMLICGMCCLASAVNFSLLAWLPTFFIRDFAWSASEIGSVYGLILLGAGSTGIVAGGWIADRLVAAGRTDGVMYTGVWSMALFVPTAAAVGLAGSGTLSLILLFGATFLGVIPVGLTPVALFQVTPNEFRGQVVSLNSLLVAVVGMGMGPLLVAWLAERVFRDEHAIGRSISIVALLAAAGSLVCAIFARRLMLRRSAAVGQTAPV